MTETRHRNWIARAGAALFLAFLLVLAGQLIGIGIGSGGPGTLFDALGVLLWLAAPTLAAWALVGASTTRTGALAFLALQGVLIGSVVWIYIGINSPEAMSSSTSGVALMILPVYQWGAILLALLLALALGWRMRPGFPRS